MTRSRPDQMMRLYRKDKAEWDLVRLVHEHVASATAHQVASAPLHDSLRQRHGRAKALGKINRYSSLKAQQNHQAGKRAAQYG
jgi:hypothetical protein